MSSLPVSLPPGTRRLEKIVKDTKHYLRTGVQEYRGTRTGVQEYRSTGVKEYRSTGVQEYRSIEV